ncbi:UDP-glycosyltransferase 72C1-like [Typha angustifolia]|uniref:UDP-glycosyltransferase 72C1-like n=1 Tax=Typha angustifolia TaxID=59011 RepID=UPI003C2F4EEE
MNSEPGKPPVYPVGPLVRTRSTEHECVQWLDRQPSGSVVYVPRGSEETLTWQQRTELALGLELSHHRFLWVVKAPLEAKANASLLSSSSTQGSNPLDFLPDGFIGRTKEFGLVLPSWAPQDKVLGHMATGVFLSHCGWNSLVESITNGVALFYGRCKKILKKGKG